MKNIVASAAALALLAAAPVFAQDNDHHEHGGNGPHAMTAQHPDRNPNHGNMGHANGPRPGPNPTPQAAPQAATRSNSAMMEHNERGGRHGGQNNNAYNRGSMAGPDENMRSSSRSERHGLQNNNGYNNHAMGGSMAGPNQGMRGPSRGERGGERPHVSNFNSYHRNFHSARRYRAPAYRRPPGWYAHRWTFGERLPAPFFVSSYWINDYFDFGLVPPPYGTVWVRYGADALLVDQASGEVIQVVYGVFY